MKELEKVLNSIDELYHWACQSDEVTPNEVLETVKVIEDYLGVRK